VSRSNGPFEHPDAWDKYKLFNKITFAPNDASSLSVGEMSYGANWNGSGQLPARAVERGLVSRFGALDPDEGGGSARHQLYVRYRLRPSATAELNALTYLAAYRFDLFSNFTLFLRDPVHGDEIEQLDRRTFFGGRVNYRVQHELFGLRFDTRIGADGRNDDIHSELRDSEQRATLAEVRDDGVHETLGGVFINEEVTPLSWLRFDLGGRADLLAFEVDDRLASSKPSAPHGGSGAAHQLSPKTSLIVTPLQRRDAQLDLYVNYGHGFHSNDVRGAFSTPRITPLTRAVGEEVGTRTRLFERWDLAVAFWQLDLARETVWNGDQGTTEVSGATRRRGVELETRYELTSWLAADLDVTFTQAAFWHNPGNGDGLALAPKQTWSGGLSARHELGPGLARAGLRFFGIGDRPATDDGTLVARGFTQLDLQVGYRHQRFDLAFDVENLLDGTFRSAQFATVSRLHNEPALGDPLPRGFSCGSNGRLARAPDGAPSAGIFHGCEDVSYTPAYPRTLRVLATVFLD
jgi:TonB-dependent receptor-like protein